MIAALAALQRKKVLEKDLDKWTATKNTIESEIFALENANINLETMKAMKAGADAMKGIHGSLYSLLLVGRVNLDHRRRLIRLWMILEIKWLFLRKLVKLLLDLH
jgi:Snf7